MLLNRDHLKGMLAFDEAKMQCTVQAGTRLEDLGEYRAPINQALLNQGDISKVWLNCNVPYGLPRQS
ncbi:MAG: FAD-dependent oxidoreductase [Acinetobacter sp.]|nr:hypothetical protein [Acinetobacter sp.]MDN5510780.1 FAD-dependent oxidoreductase [Acinetobacter sp.]MDN5523895.1 FAD-dependent oxidoreductase [Acinetobacter sp.]